MTTSDINPPAYARPEFGQGGFGGPDPDRSDFGRHGQSRDHDRDRDAWARRDDDRDGWSPSRGRPTWIGRAEGWLDDRGRGAWIAAMILGFVFFWPIGLALLAYMIWSKRMFSKSCKSGWSRQGRHSQFHAARSAMRPSGNSAFDSYKAETLRRLEDEQSSFEAFLERLREAKDKAEFDQFMEDRARKATESRDEGQTA